MRPTTIIRISLLAMAIAAGVFFYPESRATGPDPSAITGFSPSPVTVTPLSDRS